jgi:hypothetical protein
MPQNTSHAVMAQRAEPLDSLDNFPTPPWATRALCEHLMRGGHDLGRMSVWEPACGQGYMAMPLGEYFGKVLASDIHPHGFGSVRDFLATENSLDLSDCSSVDAIITNPPFRLAAEFAFSALERAQHLVALLVRNGFLESTSRYRRLFAPHPPGLVLQFAERVPMVKGRCDPKATTATSYAWVVWLPNDVIGGTKLEWIAPCRAALERQDDYGEPIGRPLLSSIQTQSASRQ